MNEAGDTNGPQNVDSCDPTLNRKQFLEKVVKRAGIVGGILIAPKVVDSFLVPPAYAMMYSANIQEDTTSQGTDSG